MCTYLLSSNIGAPEKGYQKGLKTPSPSLGKVQAAQWLLALDTMDRMKAECEPFLTVVTHEFTGLSLWEAPDVGRMKPPALK